MSQSRAKRELLPTEEPLFLLSSEGQWLADTHWSADAGAPSLGVPTDDELLELHRAMVIGRRFDTQAGALVKQGRMAVYPSSRGQDACQVGSVLALGEQDWLFPTYRDSVGGIPP